MKICLKIEDICFGAEAEQGKKEILKNVSFDVFDGEVLAITGPNGSGKSTLAKILMGILTADSGRINFLGQDITQKSVEQRANMGIAYTFQQPVTFKGLKVRDILEIAQNKTANLGECCDYLSKVGLCAKDYANRELSTHLSGGELKRIEIATTLARGAKLNIFDEPEAGIDLWSFDRLVGLFKEKKATNIIITHQSKILEIADRIVLLVDGEIKKIGSYAEILPLLKNQTCSQLLGGANE